MTKKILSIAGIATAVGLIISFIVMLMVGFDFTKLDLDEDYTEKVFTISDNEISSIKVYTDMMKVKVCYREDNSDEIRITYYENNKHNPTVVNQSGTVTLNDETGFSINNLFATQGIVMGYKRNKLETVVEIPKNNKTLKINVETSNAKITVNDLIADNLSLVTSNANIDMSGKATNDVYCQTSNASINSEDITADTITLDTSNGSCNAETVISKNFNVYTSNASINIKNISSDSVNLKTSNASINIKNISSDSVNLETSNSSINLGDVIAEKSLYASTSNGSITTNGIDSNKIELYSSNSNIVATVIGKDKDFAINSGTSNGNDNVSGRGNSSANKTLSVYTSNGNINIDFDDEYTVAKELQTILESNS